jgi:hypothetical protein
MLCDIYVGDEECDEFFFVDKQDFSSAIYKVSCFV